MQNDEDNLRSNLEQSCKAVESFSGFFREVVDLIKPELVPNASMLFQLKNIDSSIENILKIIQKSGEASIRDKAIIASNVARIAEMTGFVLGNIPDAKPWIDSLRARDAGIESGKARKAGRKWTAHAKELTIEILGEDNCLSNDKVADKIAERWKQDLKLLPGHRTLVGFVSEYEKSNAL